MRAAVREREPVLFFARLDCRLELDPPGLGLPPRRHTVGVQPDGGGSGHLRVRGRERLADQSPQRGGGLLGGEPVPADRTQAHGLVGEVVAAFNATDRLILALAPEGTRAADKGFKSGFLYMARGANVPIVLVYFDFPNRVVGFGPLFTPSGDVECDMNEVLNFYRPIRGKYLKHWQRED